MLTKLKFLSGLYQRDILPAPGVAIGKILYTRTNTTGRRIQFVHDVDAATVKRQSINPYPADPKTQPGAIVEIDNMFPPFFDKLLYIKQNTMPGVIAILDNITVTGLQGMSGYVAVIPNVLTHGVDDSIGGVTATLSNVNLEYVSGDAELILNVLDGSVDLAIATAPGEYTLTYKITDKNEPTNFTTTTVTVEVLPSVLVTTTDSIVVTAQQGIDGVVGVIADVLANDTIDGVPATLSNVDLENVSGDAELTLNVLDGSIDLASATIPGEYTLTYKITDKNNMLNFITGTVQVTVSI